MSQRIYPDVVWRDLGLSRPSPLALGGYCEFLEVDPSAEAIAVFKSSEAILDGRPAATLRKLGRGSVVKLAFWPGDDSLLRLIPQLVPGGGNFLAAPAPQGVVAVPHVDNSLFVVNTSGEEMRVSLAHSVADRLSETRLSGNVKLQPYQVWWLA